MESVISSWITKKKKKSAKPFPRLYVRFASANHFFQSSDFVYNDDLFSECEIINSIFHTDYLLR